VLSVNWPREAKIGEVDRDHGSYGSAMFGRDRWHELAKEMVPSIVLHCLELAGLRVNAP